MNRLIFLVVDQDGRRAAAIASALAGFRGVKVVETAEELAAAKSVRRIVLAGDEPGAVQRITGRLNEHGIRAKIIAYAEETSHHQMVKAIAAGAADYLQWPCDAANIIAAANAATADVLD